MQDQVNDTEVPVIATEEAVTQLPATEEQTLPDDANKTADDGDDGAEEVKLFESDSAEVVEGDAVAADDKPDTRGMRELRLHAKAQERERKRLEGELAALRQKVTPVAAEDEEPRKPDPNDDDILWDSAALATKMDEYVHKKMQFEAKKQQRVQAERAEVERAQTALQEYRKTYDTIAARRPEAVHAEAAAADALSSEQQAAIFETVDSPKIAAQLIYQIGLGLLDDNEKAKALVALDGKDMFKFTKQIALLESGLKNPVKRAAVPAPDKPISAAAAAKTVDAMRDAAYEKASKTGNINDLVKLYRKGST